MTATLEQTTQVEDRSWSRVELFGVSIDAITMCETLTIVQSWATADFDRCRCVVTPNVDHTVLLQDHQGLQAAYHDADLVVADGWPVVSASRFLRKPLPEVVPGSDLVPLLMKAATVDRRLRVFLLGAAPGVGARAAENIRQRWTNVQVSGVYSPPLGFEEDETENDHILSLIGQAAPDVLVVGLGAPKQELWVHAHRDRLHAKVSLCVGATIDFLAGEKARAPRWMRRMRIEWLHRMLADPKRLVRRYARDAVVFPRLVWREWRRSIY